MRHRHRRRRRIPRPARRFHGSPSHPPAGQTHTAHSPIPRMLREQILRRRPHGRELGPRHVNVLSRDRSDLLRRRHHPTSMTSPTDNPQSPIAGQLLGRRAPGLRPGPGGGLRPALYRRCAARLSTAPPSRRKRENILPGAPLTSGQDLCPSSFAVSLPGPCPAPIRRRGEPVAQPKGPRKPKDQGDPANDRQHPLRQPTR